MYTGGERLVLLLRNLLSHHNTLFHCSSTITQDDRSTYA